MQEPVQIENIVGEDDVEENNTSPEPIPRRYSSKKLQRVDWLYQRVNRLYNQRGLHMHINGVNFSYPVDGCIEIKERGHNPRYVNPQDTDALRILMSATHRNAINPIARAIRDYYNQVRALHLEGSINH